MARFIAWRVAQFPLILAAIYLITFLLAWVAPGSPFDRTERKLPPAVEQSLKRSFHAEHWYGFLAYYPKNVLLSGDFGRSFNYEEFTVNDILRTSLPVSVTLGMCAMVIATFAGVGLGVLAAVRRGGTWDGVSLTVALLGVSVPAFVIAAALSAIFCIKLRWLPFGQWGNWRDLLLPSVALSLMPMAYIARLMRVAMIDVLAGDFVRTARAKGLSNSVVIWKHCLRNAFLPVLSYLGPAAAMTLTGSFVVEKVFNIPGLGQHFVNSVLNRDQTLILGTVMVYSVFLLTFNLLVDIGYAVVDPRIELGK
ncbi:MAG: ABC transporter permease [Phycisphaerales bacterium]|jgi:ABC-type dipeptide/oligopeptide/nickel transport system permease component|nr:ABC transporter permease [Phycisphaerales bacterium]